VGAGLGPFEGALGSAAGLRPAPGTRQSSVASTRLIRIVPDDRVTAIPDASTLHAHRSRVGGYQPDPKGFTPRPPSVLPQLWRKLAGSADLSAGAHRGSSRRTQLFFFRASVCSRRFAPVSICAAVDT